MQRSWMIVGAVLRGRPHRSISAREGRARVPPYNHPSEITPTEASAANASFRLPKRRLKSGIAPVPITKTGYASSHSPRVKRFFTQELSDHARIRIHLVQHDLADDVRHA